MPFSLQEREGCPEGPRRDALLRHLAAASGPTCSLHLQRIERLMFEVGGAIIYIIYDSHFGILPKI